MPPIILASASPRRAELLQQLGISFEIMSSDAEEVHDESLPPAEVARINAERKAQAVAAKNPGRVVLSADTVVSCEGKLFGKPKDLEEAAEMLRALSGKTHQVITAVTLAGSSRIETFHDVTDVTFRALTDGDIQTYLAKVQVLDKAGAYGIQEHGDILIEKIVGSRSNVVGLPLEMLSGQEIWNALRSNSRLLGTPVSGFSLPSNSSEM